MEKESNKYKNRRLSSRILTSDDLHRARMKYMRASIATLQASGKDIPLIYKGAGLALKYMKSLKLNLHEACDKITLVKPIEDVGPGIEDLMRLTLFHENEINYLIKRVKILEDNLDLDPFLIKIAIAELLWGKLIVKFSSMDAIYLRYYEPDLKEAFVETITVFDSAENSYSSKLPVYIRINTLSISLEESIHAFYQEGWNLLPRSPTYLKFLDDVRNLKENEFIRDFHISELLVFPPGTSFYGHSGYLEGKFFIQDKGSCLATFLLNPKPGSRVLDMFAAPGFTTNHIANMMKNEGVIYANDNHPDRYNRLCLLMDLTNVTCVEPMNEAYWDIKMDDLNYILLDVSSTYSGINHKKSDKGLYSHTRHLRYKSTIMLTHALYNFPNVKRVVYASCSIYPDEGEKVVEMVLRDLGDSYTLLDVREMLWNEWVTVGDIDLCGDKCLRTNPEFDLCQGYFIAVFERNFSVPVPPCPVKIKRTAERESKERKIKMVKKEIIALAPTPFKTRYRKANKTLDLKEIKEKGCLLGKARNKKEKRKKDEERLERIEQRKAAVPPTPICQSFQQTRIEQKKAALLPTPISQSFQQPRIEQRKAAVLPTPICQSFQPPRIEQKKAALLPTPICQSFQQPRIEQRKAAVLPTPICQSFQQPRIEQKKAAVLPTPVCQSFQQPRIEQKKAALLPTPICQSFQKPRIEQKRAAALPTPMCQSFQQPRIEQKKAALLPTPICQSFQQPPS